MTAGAALASALLSIPFVSGDAAQASSLVDVTVTIDDHTYDRGATATITGCTIDTDTTGFDVACDTSGASASFDSTSVGTGLSVTVTGLALSGLDSGDFAIDVISATGNIVAAELTADSATADSRDYDATTDATISSCVLGGLVIEDDVTCSGVGTFDSKDAGTGKDVTITSLTLGGADSANYTLSSTYPTGTTADVYAIDLTVSAIDADGKDYDGTTDAVISDCTLDTVLGSDDVTCSGTGSFDTAAAGTGKTVTADSLSLGGTDAANYNLTGTYPTDTAAIDPLELSVTSVTVDAKDYDGTTDATISDCVLDGVIDGDVVTCSGTGDFVDAGAGTGKDVTVTDITLGGDDNGNYTVSTSYPSATGDIDPLTLTVTPDDQTITYGDSTDAALFTFGVTGFLDGEGTGDASYVAPECGAAYTAGDPAGRYTITCSGGSMDNYEFDYDTATLTVEAFEIPADAVWYTGQNEKYTSSASETLTKVTLSATLSLDLIDQGADETCADTSMTVADAKVTFTDRVSGKLLAKDVPVSEVAGNCEEGIATVIATLSAGTNGTEVYVIVVTVTGSMSGSNLAAGGQIDTDLATAQVTVSQPRAAGTISGAGDLTVVSWSSLTDVGTSGSLTTDMGGDAATATFRFVPGTKKVLPKGQAVLIIPAADGGIYYVKSNSITSIVVGATVTSVYTRASIVLVGGTCATTCSIDGGVSLRLDVTTANNQIAGITIQSTKTSALYYSNHWYKSGRVWTTALQTLI
ncbi:MAG: YDG domain-containing protein [Ilumatobacteraceae bacterium]